MSVHHCEKKQSPQHTVLRSPFVAATYLGAAAVLMRENDLSPHNPRINDTLGPLVNLLSASYTPQEERLVLRDPNIRKVRTEMLGLLSAAEGAMEKTWANKFCENQTITKEDMATFWYWQNYIDLATREAEFFAKRTFKPGESICFVGSGPLPLTAVVLNMVTGQKVTCVDNDPVAAEISREFIHKAGLSDQIKIVCSDGADYDFSKHPAVLTAALVPNKREVEARAFETRPDALFGMRSAEKMHVLLYDPVNEKDFAHNEFVGRTPYVPDIINTTIFYNLRPRPASNDNASRHKAMPGGGQVTVAATMQREP